jgi:DNA-binding response OmpR family regulator
LKVLIVEDDESVARFLQQAMMESGYEVESVHDGRIALETALARPFDLILLDLMLPSMGGLDICRNVRSHGIRTPILVITARDMLEDKIAGLDSGADDYVVKPFQIAELMARSRALLRRSAAGAQVLCVCDLTIDPAARVVTRNGKRIHLSATEYSLLEFLMRNAGRTVTRSTIMDHVWQYDFDGNDNVLDVYISYLRNKIDRGDFAPVINTVRGVGFRFGDEDAA